MKTYTHYMRTKMTPELKTKIEASSTIEDLYKLYIDFALKKDFEISELQKEVLNFKAYLYEHYKTHCNPSTIELLKAQTKFVPTDPNLPTEYTTIDRDRDAISSSGKSLLQTVLDQGLLRPSRTDMFRDELNKAITSLDAIINLYPDTQNFTKQDIEDWANYILENNIKYVYFEEVQYA